MTRRGFLRGLGLGAVAAAVVPADGTYSRRVVEPPPVGRNAIYDHGALRLSGMISNAQGRSYLYDYTSLPSDSLLNDPWFQAKYGWVRVLKGRRDGH